MKALVIASLALLGCSLVNAAEASPTAHREAETAKAHRG